MSKINITDFSLKLGWEGREINRGLDKLEKRLSKLNKNISGAAKLAVTNAKLQNQLLAQKKRMALADLNIAKQKSALDVQKARTDIADIKRMEAHDKRRSARRLQQLRHTSNERREQERLSRSEATSENISQRRATSAERTARASAKTRRNTGKTKNNLRDSVRYSGSLASNMAKGAVAFGAAYGVGTAISSTVRTGTEYSREKVSLTSVAEEIARSLGIKDTKGFARQQVTYARKTADDLNRSIVDTTQSYKNVLAANLEVIKNGGTKSFRGVQDTFRGFTKAGAYSKASKDEMRLMMRAITQMSQKGKVQAEEVTGQLAERSPFAMQAMIKAARVVTKNSKLTSAEFFKLMENGKLLAEQILPEAGRQIENIVDNLAGNDLKKFIESSTAGTFSGVQTAIEGQQINIFDGLDKSLSRLLKNFSAFMNDMDWLTKPTGVWLGNFIDGAAESLMGLHAEMKRGEGVWGKLAGFMGILNFEDFENSKGKVTLEQQAEASERLAVGAGKAYKSFSLFTGGFLTGFSETILDIVEAVKSILEKLGIGGKDGKAFSAGAIGEVLGSLAALQFTGMIALLDKILTVLPALTRFGTSKLGMSLIGLSAAGAAGGFDGMLGDSSSAVLRTAGIVMDDSTTGLQKTGGLAKEAGIFSFKRFMQSSSPSLTLSMLSKLPWLGTEKGGELGSGHLNKTADSLGMLNSDFTIKDGFFDMPTMYQGSPQAALSRSQNQLSSYPEFGGYIHDRTNIQQQLNDMKITIDINRDGTVTQSEVMTFSDAINKGIFLESSQGD